MVSIVSISYSYLFKAVSLRIDCFFRTQKGVIDLCVRFGTKDTVSELVTRNIYRMNSQFSNTIIFYCSEYMELL